ncbi:MAG: DUF29 domain-containing protein [Pseudomonadota bacterium]
MNQLTKSNNLDATSDPAGYERDFALWIETQLEILRARKFEQLDLDNVIEELADMGKDHRRELRSRLEVLLIHLLKCQFQAEHKSRSWLSTIRAQRSELHSLLAQSPSLKGAVDAYATDAYPAAVERAAIEIFPSENPFTPTQLLDTTFIP